MQTCHLHVTGTLALVVYSRPYEQICRPLALICFDVGSFSHVVLQNWGMKLYNIKLLIGGDLVDGDGQLDVINPATGQSFITVGRASLRQLDQAVAAARAAQPNGQP
jgi:hypothetical protein